MDGNENSNTTSEFLSDVVDGLSKEQKTLSPKYFYDANGSALFDQICELQEYYPTRTEIGVLSERADEIAQLVEGQHLIEFGSGSSVKIRVLLDAADGLASYVPVDISREHLFEAARSIANDYPSLDVVPVCADFTKTFSLPDSVTPGDRVGFFPGSTIGNFSRLEAENFLVMAAGMLGNGGGLVIGVDLKKDPKLLHAAYNDARGITADFNLNLLTRINRELNGTFDIESFAHDARYVEDKGRVEMHLVSLKDQTVLIGEQPFDFKKDESIHTENSHKYDIEEFHEMGRTAGFAPGRTWTDKNDLFSVHYLEVAA